MLDLKIIETVFDKVSENSLTESQRLLHGRGRCYPGFEQITIDWFSPIIFITQFKALESIDFEELALALLATFNKKFPKNQLSTIVLQNRSEKEPQLKVLWGEMPEAVYAQEGVAGKDLNFLLDFTKQNLGFFLDAKNARAYLSEITENKKVLNLFSFTCAFSVVAMASGASSVVNLDMGKGVLERGKENHMLNGFDIRDVAFVKSDIFKAWKKLHKLGRYDVIIIDPPSFQKGSFNAEKDYVRIVRNLKKLLTEEAVVIACLNSPFLEEDFLDKLFLENELNKDGCICQKLKRIDNPAAFQDIDKNAALKVLVYKFQRLNMKQ
jgi:23S rRNA (cytosine1962-C5)-methyltransferase